MQKDKFQFVKSIFCGFLWGGGFFLGFFSTALLAVAVNGTIKTWVSGEVLTATDLNTTISSLKTTIEGIPNWTKSGSNAYYTDGNVGIGTSSPSSLLHIKGPQNITSRLINLEAPQMSDQSEATIDFTEDNGVVVGRMGLIRDASAPTGFDFFIGNLWNNAVTTSKLFYIRSDGNVGIGTTSPNDKLQVVGDIRVGSSGTDGCIKRFDGGTLTGSCSSDARLKKSIQPLKSSLSRLLGLTPVKFSWKKDKFDFLKNSPTSETGLLAQDVEKVFPHLVSTDNKGFKKVNYGMELNMHVIGAVKELAKENEELKSKNAKLEKELEQTTKRIEKIEKLLGGK